MPVYLDVLVVLNFLVDFLLIVGTNRLAGYPTGARRAVPAATLGGVYAGVCILPGCGALAGTFFRLLVLTGMGAIAFGIRREAGRRCVLFVLLSMALGGVAVGLQSGFWSIVLCAGGVCLLCVLGFRGRVGQQYVPVKVAIPAGNVEFLALRDSGNTLTDPLTGQQIMVVGPGIAMALTGLSHQQLERPAEALHQIPSLRLIPFHAVGKAGGVMAAKRFENVTIGNWHGSCLIAFAPNDIGQGKPYDALTGGV